MSRRRRPSLIRLPRNPRHAALLILLILLLAGLRLWQPDWFKQAPAEPRPLESGVYRVARIIDGDTFLIVDGDERIRLIGADTPETVHPKRPVESWGPEATLFTKDFLAGDEVRLEFDGPSRDKYGRILAYAYVGERMLNEELIRAGLARARLRYPYSSSIKERFRRAENEAKSARRGIWSE